MNIQDIDLIISVSLIVEVITKSKGYIFNSCISNGNFEIKVVILCICAKSVLK